MRFARTVGMRARLSALLAATIACAPAWSQSLPIYRLDPLPIGFTGPKVGYSAVDLNNTGTAVGNLIKRGQYSAVAWSGTPLTESALPPPSRSAFEQVYAVSDSGIAGGTAEIRRGQVPVLWTPSIVTLAPFPGGGVYGSVVDINASGTAAGQVGGRAALWPSPTSAPIDIGYLPQSTTQTAGITALNDSGDVVGGAGIDGTIVHAFLWTAASGMMDLGTLAGTVNSTAKDVNVNRAVIGTSGYPNLYRPFYWSASTGMSEMGTVAGFEQVEYRPAKLNDHGLAVGSFTDPSTQAGRSFLWTRSTGMVDLASRIDPADPLQPEVVSLTAVSINERNEILVNVGLRDVYPARPMILRPSN
jgi:probable HAF family extracellular repeat protein